MLLACLVFVLGFAYEGTCVFYVKQIELRNALGIFLVTFAQGVVGVLDTYIWVHDITLGAFHIFGTSVGAACVLFYTTRQDMHNAR